EGANGLSGFYSNTYYEALFRTYGVTLRFLARRAKEKIDKRRLMPELARKQKTEDRRINVPANPCHQSRLHIHENRCL
ncbi:MAG TPA: hypothetical protein PLU06_01150, partial [Candidatus Syntrophosphaera sp.]|nr:hypothetical protein [Candidatus Syntrophosphaera sp.]